MVALSLRYTGDLHCDITHGPSGAQLATDAPKDNHGKGESFSPTDLVAAAYGSCVLTVMGIAAEKLDVSIDDSTMDIVKTMASAPIRRIAALNATAHMHSDATAEQRLILEKAAHSCPVGQSLHPDVVVTITFDWMAR